MLINLCGSEKAFLPVLTDPCFALTAGWILLNSTSLFFGAGVFVSLFFPSVLAGINKHTKQFRHASCFVWDGGGGGNPICMPLPGRAPLGFGHECASVHGCVYFGEITMGGCVFTLHGKIILLTVWKINDMSLFLQPRAPEVAWRPWPTRWRYDSASSPSLVSHLLLCSPDSLPSPFSLPSITIYRVLLCSSLFSLLCW